MEPAIFRNDEQGRDAFVKLAERAAQWISDYYRNIESFPVRSQVKPRELYDQFPDLPSSAPGDADALFKILNETIVPGITHWQHPNFYAFFPGNTSFPSIVAEFITSAIAAQCMMWESSPIATELEQRCMEWCRDLIGLPKPWEGVIQDTASTATLTAILTAREWKSGFRISKRGFDNTVYKVYTSAQAHSSVEKAVRLAGIGTDNCVQIAVDENLSMQAEVLEAMILQDVKNGSVPLCVVSTIGTTASGAIDDVNAVSDIANKYGLWHHVDAAYAGTALMLEEYHHLRNGIAASDSFVFNPHKWMFIQFDCSVYFVKDPELLIRTMSTSPSYLMSQYGDRVNNYRDWGIPLGRRFRALKFWMTLHLLGTDAIKNRLRHHIALAEKIEHLIISDKRLVLASKRNFNIITFSIRQDIDQDSSLTKQLSQLINDSGKAYMTHAVVQGRSLVRWVPGQTYVEERHIESTWTLLQNILNDIIPT